MEHIKLGSLFDGIGAFPYAASLLGMKTLWASEILPHAVSVTRRHFPDMEHVGDITKLNGATLAPVDIIAFGSPCQDLSQAAGGKRAGLAGERSGLFREAIRIINEMRCATNGHYPRYACFENVPGCMSSNSRRDFAAVLEAFAESDIPMPESGRWANAGLVRGQRAHIAWCVYDAQHFGLAQRRKRLFLICDFDKGCPEQILLVPKSLPRHFTQGCTSGQGTAHTAESGAFGAGIGISGHIAGTLDANYGKGTGVRCGREREIVLCAASGQSNTEILENLSPTLNCNCEQPIIYAEKAEHIEPQAYGICAFSSNSMKSDNPHSGIYEADTARTLDLNCGNPTCNQGGMAILAFNGGASPQAGSIALSDKVSPTLKSASSGLRTPCVCEPCVAILNDHGGRSLNVEKGSCSPTLRCSIHCNLPIVCALPPVTMRIRAGCEGGGKGALLQIERSGTLATGNDQYLFDPCGVHPEICGTLCASAAGLSRPAGMASETDLAVAFATFSRQSHDEYSANDIASTQTACQHKCATDLCVSYGHPVAVDCRNLNEQEISGTLQAKTTAGYSLNYQNPVRMGYIVRRLTPSECEKLMGFDVGWTAYGHDGIAISDSRRYSMLGNSIATPCAAYIIEGILEQYAKEAIV